jgi:hypothetical protein
VIHVDAPNDTVIEGLKLVKRTGSRIDSSDDPEDLAYPYRLEVNLRPPELMQVAFVMLYGGSDDIVVRGKTRAAIDRFVELNNLRRHPRLRRLTITGPCGLREEVTR